MIILFHLFFLSFSHQCKYQIFPKLGQPSEETFNVDEGEHICINSSGNYFNVLFHNSLLSVRYFTSSKSISQSINNNAQPQINKNLVEAGKFLFPSEKGGVSFPKSVHGSIEVTTLIPGNVTISTLSFPDECTLGRYVSTESSLELHIANTFGTYPASEKNTQEQSSLCVWYPQNDYTLQASISPSQDDHIFVCSSYSSCEEPFSRTQQYIDISSNKFIKVIPKTKDFWTDLNLIFSTDNPSNLFQISGIMKDDENAVSYQLSMKKVDNEEDENEEDNKHVKAKANENIEDDNNNDNDNDNDNINNVNNENDNQARAYIKNSTPDFHRHRKNRRSNSDSYSTLVVFLSAFVCLFLVSCLIVYIISQNGSCSKNRSHPNDHSEERLLPNSQGGFFPAYAMPWGQHPPGQGFFTGVFPFAGVPGQPQQPQQQMQYFTSPGSTFQNVPNFPQQDNQNDQNNKNENNQSQQQMQFQQPVVYVVPPQYQQQYMQQQQQYMQQYQQNLPQYPQNTPTQQQTNENQPQQQNDKNQSQEQNQENQP